VPSRSTTSGNYSIAVSKDYWIAVANVSRVCFTPVNSTDFGRFFIRHRTY